MPGNFQLHTTLILPTVQLISQYANSCDIQTEQYIIYSSCSQNSLLQTMSLFAFKFQLDFFKSIGTETFAFEQRFDYAILRSTKIHTI
jgi:hypothetical protein